MKKDKKNDEINDKISDKISDNMEQVGNSVQDEQETCPACEEKSEVLGKTAENAECTENHELIALKEQLNDKSRLCDEYFNMLQRTAAEFDNFKKRTAREKEALYAEAMSEAVAAFLPVADNIERAIRAFCKEHDESSLREGVELVNRQVKDIIKSLGVEEIKSVGEIFNPGMHDAVMHVDDDSYGHDVIVEEFQKGYMLGDRIIRHSMVKVAN